MDILSYLKEKAGKDKKTIVLPEGRDERVLKAAEIVLNEDIAKIIIIGNTREIDTTKYKLDNATIIDPKKYELTNKFIEQLFSMRKDKGMSIEEANKYILENNMYFACMLVINGLADGIVSGSISSTADTLRPALQTISTKENIKNVSSFFLVDVPNCNYGENGKFIFADCGLLQYPTSIQLAEIAKLAADSFISLLQKEPIIAMLSHSTLGSAKHAEIDKVVEAKNIFKNNYKNYKIEGELQLDAAIVPEIAKIKAPNSKYAGSANVLIFPNIDAANIGYKLVEKLAKAKCYGPITQGFVHPVNDLSRGCNHHDIVGVITITAIQAQNKKSTI